MTADQSFGRRLAAVFAGEVVNKGFVIATFVWLARTLTPAVYGDVEWALSLTIVFTLVADAGLSTWGATRIAATPDEAPLIVWRVGRLRMTLAALSYLVLLAVAVTYGGPAGSALTIYGLTLFWTPLFLQYLFNGLLQPRWGALGQVIRGATFALAALLLVHAGSSPSVVAAAEVIGAAALALCNLLIARTIFRLPPRLRWTTRDLRSVLEQSWPIGASEVTWGVMWYAGLILLGYLATATDAAWHSAALRIAMSLHTIVWLYLCVLLPNLARLVIADAEGWAQLMQRSLRLTGWIGCGIALGGTLAGGTILTTVFGAPFAAAIPGFRATIWIVPVAWASGHFRYSLIAARHPRKEYRAALIGAGTTIALSVLLVPALRSLGAGLALLGGVAANAVSAVILGRRVLPRCALRESIVPAVACCVACLALGAILTPITGEITSVVTALVVFSAFAIHAERDSARELVQALGGNFKLRVARTDANT